MTHGRGVESMFAYLMVGMGILAVFVIGVFALGQSQQFSARAVRQDQRPATAVTTEIGGDTAAPR